jgi:hypothetical protein
MNINDAIKMKNLEEREVASNIKAAILAISSDGRMMNDVNERVSSIVKNLNFHFEN